MSKCKEGHTISPLYGYCVECYEDWRTEMFEEQEREEEEIKAQEEAAERHWEDEWDKEIDRLNDEFREAHKGKEDTITREYYEKWMDARMNETYRKTRTLTHNKGIYNQSV